MKESVLYDIGYCRHCDAPFIHCDDCGYSSHCECEEFCPNCGQNGQAEPDPDEDYDRMKDEGTLPDYLF